ncbi:ABC transporter ATP-binding protein [Butyrivibrio sp. AE3004]|uniref:ABC transporter ATP-binding protein n=1 Tax=Butyrivibrio sp. AE3004 TaxID=1506994 RepID=UPI000494AB99|nr:ABC transporter ATP-binding protein [Butyrivibrio sp. AE3004]
MSNTLLTIRNLAVSVTNKKKSIPIVKGIDIDIPRGQIVGLVGESGCGKSMTAKSIMGILPHSAHMSGSILWNDPDGSQTELTGLNEKELRKMCGPKIGMVFQEPMTSLNPMMKIGDQIAEVLFIHKLVKNRAEAKEKVIRILDEVGIQEPERNYNSYPHMLSGGMRQRVMIAMAVICDPDLLIADEPTTALDVTIEAQILKLIRHMCETHNMSALVITHNMGVVSTLCDKVYVMYMGRILERAQVDQLFKTPLHPYTRGLLSSIPRIHANPEYLTTIPGNIPEFGKEAAGCDFCLRCSDDERRCFFEKPAESEIEKDHFVSCFNANSRSNQP